LIWSHIRHVYLRVYVRIFLHVLTTKCVCLSVQNLSRLEGCIGHTASSVTWISPVTVLWSFSRTVSR
jgi:hypothetical protein